MTRSLIIARAGLRSLHNSWVDPGVARDWDVYVSPYQPLPYVTDPASQIIVGPVTPGTKWTGLTTLLDQWQGWRDYDYILLADDDVFCTAQTWSRFFSILRQRKPALAQPALTRDSYFSHLVTLQNPSFVLRSTSFVEVMAPCFRVDALAALRDTFAQSVTGWGWGLDYLWAHRLRYRDMMIVDETSMIHTRPVGSAQSPELKQRLGDELQKIMQDSGAHPWAATLAGVTHDQRVHARTSPDFLRLYLKGYWDRLADDGAAFASMMAHQHFKPPELGSAARAEAPATGS